jgi:hypothetical protein
LNDTQERSTVGPGLNVGLNVILMNGLRVTENGKNFKRKES